MTTTKPDHPSTKKAKEPRPVPPRQLPPDPWQNGKPAFWMRVETPSDAPDRPNPRERRRDR